MWRFTILVATILCTFHLTQAADQPSADPIYDLQVGTQTRSYSLNRYHADQARARLPVVIFLHGTGYHITDTLPARYDIPFTALPDMEPALIVRPQGANRVWNIVPGRVDTWRPLSGLNGEQVDDIGFLRTLIAWLVDHANGDPARVYLAGVSIGGFMVTRVACELSDRVTAVAAVIATAVRSQLEHCDAARPIPYLLLASTTDPEVPYGGRQGDELTALASAPETVAFFAKHNGCKTRTEAPLPHLDPEVNSTASLVRFTDCTRDADVLFYRIDGSGHSVPSMAPPEPGSWASRGARNRDLETAQAVWSFFREHR